MDQVLRYHIKKTDGRLLRIENKLDLLMEHKAYILGQARAIALMVSLTVSAITTLATFFLVD